MYASVVTALLVGTACPPEPADNDDDPPIDLGRGAVCSATADCGGGTPLCTDTGFCVECDPVGGDVSACDAGEVCGGAGLCGECASDADCGAGEPFCSPNTGALADSASCVECRGVADCGAAAPSCDPRGECVAACSDAAPCQDGVCDPAFAACVDCVVDADCPDADKPLCSAQRTCVECNAAEDCGAAAPFCVDGSCEECIANTDCGVGAACSPDLECESRCSGDADCTDGDNARCDVDTGACRECLEDAHCNRDADQSVCVDFRCEECRVDADCPADAPTCDVNNNECQN